DSLAFGPWLLLHIERKGRLHERDAEAMARLGAAECLASGITTIGDCSFSGAAAPAADALGLRAIVYVEVFGRTAEGVAGRFARLRDAVEPSLSERVRLGISPHAPYSASPELYEAAPELRLPVATHPSESADEDES